jgi:hypothetical protein
MHRMALAALLLALACPPARADEILEQIEAAKRLYQEGDVTGAATELDFALQALRAKAGGSLAAVMPEPPPGWSAGPVEQGGGAMAFMGGTMLTRVYSETGGPGRIEAQIIANNAMIQGFAAMLANPAVLAARPGTQRVRIGRDNALLEWKAAERAGDLALVTGAAMIRLEGRGLDGGEALIALLRRFDLDRLRELTR